MSGEFVKELPPDGRSKVSADWDSLVIKCQENPGEILLAAKDVPETTIKSLRQRNRYPFIKTGGHLSINQRDMHVSAETGKNHATVYFTWVEDITEEEK